MSRQLYFIAIIPESTVCDEVTEFKAYASEHFQSSHALKSPPHITLIPPFRMNQQEIEQLQNGMPKWLSTQKEFTLQLDGFGVFSPKVIYVSVLSDITLIKLQKNLKNSFEKAFGFQPDKRNEFHPHMTVAFKDLSRSNFYKAREYFGQIDYKRTIYVKKIYLLDHRNKKWNIHTRWNFR